MRSVLVVATRQIGDVLLTTPLIRQAHALWPGCAVDVLGFEGTLGMLRGNPDVRELIAVPARLRLGGFRRLAARLWRRYDAALITDPGDRAHLIGWLASSRRAGVLPRESSSNWWKRALLEHAVISAGDLGEEHVVAEKLRLLDPWRTGMAQRPAQLVAPAPEPLPQELQQALLPGYVVVHAPSMWPYKQWPLEHFRQLVAFLATAGRQVVLTGSNGEHDRACVQAMRGAAPAAMLLEACGLSFNQLAGLLRGGALYIGPDTSVSHLAAACGVPVLAVFGPTNPQRWAPWPAGSAPVFVRRAPVQTVGQVTLMQSTLGCVPCGRAGCEDHRQSPTECLPGIEPGRVAAQALEMLSAKE